MSGSADGMLCRPLLHRETSFVGFLEDWPGDGAPLAIGESGSTDPPQPQEEGETSARQQQRARSQAGSPTLDRLTEGDLAG